MALKRLSRVEMAVQRAIRMNNEVIKKIELINDELRSHLPKRKNNEPMLLRNHANGKLYDCRTGKVVEDHKSGGKRRSPG